MRLLILFNRVPFPAKDGGAIAMLNMLKGLADQKLNIHILAFNTRKHYIEPAEIPAEILSLGKWQFVDLDASITPWGAITTFFTGKSYNLTRFDIPEMHRQIKLLLHEENFDIVQLEGFYLSPYTHTIRQNSTAKIVMRAHNIEHYIWERLAENERNFLKKSYLQTLAKRLKNEEIKRLNDYDAIVAITSHDAEGLRKMGARVPVLVSPAGINVNDYTPRQEQAEENTVFHLGSLDWQPNQKAVIWFIDKVWPMIIEKHPTACFFVAGRNLPDFMKTLSGKGIEIVGEVDDAVAFMHSKQIMVVPLQSGSGMRLKIIEGMAAGKAIVSTPLGAEGIDCTHGKDILLAESANELARAIVLLLKDQSLLRKLGENARVLAKEKYSNFAIIKKLVEAYKEEETWLSGT